MSAIPRNRCHHSSFPMNTIVTPTAARSTINSAPVTTVSRSLPSVPPASIPWRRPRAR